MCSPGACWPCPWQSVDLKLGRESQSRFWFGKLTLFCRNGQGQVTCPHGLKVWGVSPHHLGREPQVEPSSQAWVWEKKHRRGDPRVTLPEDSLQRLLWEGHGRSHWPRASVWPQTKRQDLWAAGEAASVPLVTCWFKREPHLLLLDVFGGLKCKWALPRKGS